MKKVGLSLKFYIVSLFFLALAVFVWYGIVFLCTNEVLTEDGTAMDETAKTVLAAAMSVIALSWSLSLLTILRQMLLG